MDTSQKCQNCGKRTNNGKYFETRGYETRPTQTMITKGDSGIRNIYLCGDCYSKLDKARRQYTIEQFNEFLSEKAAALEQLQAETQAQLDAITNKIAKASWWRRVLLQFENKENRDAIMGALQTQQQSLNSFANSIRAYAADPNGSDGKIWNEYLFYDKYQEDIRGTIKTNMDALRR